MADTFFLPGWPIPANPMIWVGVLLLAGIAGGEAVNRYLRLPRITGYAAAGLLLGPGALSLIGTTLLGELRVFIDIAMGMILFELGQRIDLRWLRRTPALVLMGVVESLCAALAVFFVLRYAFDYAALPASVGGAIAASTSPAVVMRVSAELRAEGQITERALILVAINSVLAFVVLTMLLPWVHLEYQGGIASILLHPLYLLAASLLVAFVAGWITLRIVAFVGKGAERQYAVVIAMVVLTVGVAVALKVPVLLALLAFGAMVRNLDREHHFLVVDFGRAGQLFYVILFVVTGAMLDLRLLAAVGGAAVAFVIVRWIGKAVGVMLLAPLVGLSLRHATLLAVALAPMSGLAVVMVHETSGLYPQLAESIAPVVLAAVVILELLGPIATQYALRRAGEASPETRA
ncbi:MAG: cation:proton antiporter [Burkholderiales bacterium]|nr:cation:proton antiporter [Burkholderiales bacterium]PZN05337.1 MAG: sodium:proton antiporter [Pseudomonadota bacterium]